MKSDKAIPQPTPEMAISHTVKAQPTIKASAPVVNDYFKVKDGWYHLVKLDNEGQEILGSDVQVSPRDYDRVFKTLPNYKVKKNPKK